MNNEEFEAFMESVREESREYSLDNDAVSYAYISGVLEAYLRNAVSDNESSRTTAINTMKSCI
jgi:hypothetical protein